MDARCRRTEVESPILWPSGAGFWDMPIWMCSDPRHRCCRKPPSSRLSQTRTLGLSQSRCCQWFTDARRRRTEARSTIWRPSSARFLRCTDLDVLRTRLLLLSEATIIEIESDPNFDPSESNKFNSLACRLAFNPHADQHPGCVGQADAELQSRGEAIAESRETSRSS